MIDPQTMHEPEATQSLSPYCLLLFCSLPISFSITYHRSFESVNFVYYGCCFCLSRLESAILPRRLPRNWQSRLIWLWIRDMRRIQERIMQRGPHRSAHPSHVHSPSPVLSPNSSFFPFRSWPWAVRSVYRPALLILISIRIGFGLLSSLFSYLTGPPKLDSRLTIVVRTKRGPISTSDIFVSPRSGFAPLSFFVEGGSWTGSASPGASETASPVFEMAISLM